MKAASIAELKSELQNIEKKALIEFCLRFARFKKENKELLSFLLFEANDPEQFVEAAKKEIENMFADINTSNVYYIKKSVRKILRLIYRYARYSNEKQVEAELLTTFCNQMTAFAIPMQKSVSLHGIYLSQHKKLLKTVSSLHPDLQHDFKRQLKKIPEI
jgi:hypothetical protein